MNPKISKNKEKPKVRAIIMNETKKKKKKENMNETKSWIFEKVKVKHSSNLTEKKERA